jgi:hypothetical protein
LYARGQISSLVYILLIKLHLDITIVSKSAYSLL